MKALASKSQTLKKNKPKVVKIARSKQTNFLDRLFLWLASKAGGRMLFLPPLIPCLFLGGGLIYFFQELGFWIGLALLVTTIAFVVMIIRLSALEGRYTIRQLGNIYFVVCATLLLATAVMEFWGFHFIKQQM